MKNRGVLLILLLIVVRTTIAQTTITLTIEGDKGKDAFIDSYTPTTNYGNHPLNLASGWTWAGTPFIVRSLMDFGLSVIPQGAAVLDARMNLSFATLGTFGGQQYGANACYLRGILQPWNEMTVNWSNQPTTDTSAQVLLPESTSASQNYLNIDVTFLVQNMVSNPDSSYGFMMILQNEDPLRAMSFASGENANNNLYPKLTVTYNWCPAPSAQFNYVDSGYNVYFTAQYTGANAYLWDFGDGNGSTIQNPSYTYTSTGIYNVCLTVTDSCGSSTWCDTIEICLQPLSSFTTTNQGLTFSFNNTSTNAGSFLWNFGNGIFSTSPNPTITYAQYGTYNVCLVSTNACGSDTSCQTLNLTNISVNELENSSRPEVFPVPSNGTINISSLPAEACRISLISADGSLVFDRQVINFRPGESIQLKQKIKGIYHLRIITSRSCHIWKIPVN